MKTLYLVASLIVSSGCTAHLAARDPDPTAVVSGDPLDRIGAERLFQRGVRLSNAGDPIRAEQYLAAAMERGYPRERALPILLQLCLRSSRLGAALAYGQPYLEQHPDDARLRYLLAAVRLGLAQVDVAYAELSHALRQRPQYADALYLRATVARDHLDDRQAAHRDFAKYLEAAPAGPHAAEASAYVRAFSPSLADAAVASAEEAAP